MFSSFSLPALFICSLSVCSGPASAHVHVFPACFLTPLPLWQATCKTVCSYFLTCMQGKHWAIQRYTRAHKNKYTHFLFALQTESKEKHFSQGVNVGLSKTGGRWWGMEVPAGNGSCVWNNTNTRLVHLQAFMGRENQSFNIGCMLGDIQYVQRNRDG